MEAWQLLMNKKFPIISDRYENAPLKIGSIVTIRIIDTNDVDQPKKRYRSDSEAQESPYTEEEWQNMKYQDYLSLKVEFEPKA